MLTSLEDGTRGLGRFNLVAKHFTHALQILPFQYRKSDSCPRLPFFADQILPHYGLARKTSYAHHPLFLPPPYPVHAVICFMFFFLLYMILHFTPRHPILSPLPPSPHLTPFSTIQSNTAWNPKIIHHWKTSHDTALPCLHTNPFLYFARNFMLPLNIVIFRTIQKK